MTSRNPTQLRVHLSSTTVNRTSGIKHCTSLSFIITHVPYLSGPMLFHLDSDRNPMDLRFNQQDCQGYSASLSPETLCPHNIGGGSVLIHVLEVACCSEWHKICFSLVVGLGTESTIGRITSCRMRFTQDGEGPPAQQKTKRPPPPQPKKLKNKKKANKKLKTWQAFLGI